MVLIQLDLQQVMMLLHEKSNNTTETEHTAPQMDTNMTHH